MYTLTSVHTGNKQHITALPGLHNGNQHGLRHCNYLSTCVGIIIFPRTVDIKALWEIAGHLQSSWWHSPVLWHTVKLQDICNHHGDTVQYYGILWNCRTSATIMMTQSSIMAYCEMAGHLQPSWWHSPVLWHTVKWQDICNHHDDTVQYYGILWNGRTSATIMMTQSSIMAYCEMAGHLQPSWWHSPVLWHTVKWQDICNHHDDTVQYYGILWNGRT